MTGTCTVGSGGVALACSSLFYFSVPALLGTVFLSCKVVEIVKVGSSTLLGKLSFRHAFVRVDSRRLACLRSHVLRAYCNFESKQAIWATPK